MADDIELFPTPSKFRAWLKKYHKVSTGVWLRLAKKGAAFTSITYGEALDEALCYGWIDSQKKAYDAQSWLQRFGPRTARSGWSKINVEHVKRLTKEGRMQAAGLAAYKAAEGDGRLTRAYDSPKNAEPPADFLRALNKNPAAKAFYNTLNRANVFAIVYRLQTAKKPETRARRMLEIVAKLARGEKFH
jgi:uncharacterized protein YdeI (YjbR/CyaY-like superfamily)